MALLRLLLTELQVYKIRKKFKMSTSGTMASTNDLSAYVEKDFLHTYPDAEILKIEQAIVAGVRQEVKDLFEKSKSFTPPQYNNDVFRFHGRKDSLYFNAFYYVFGKNDTIEETVSCNLRFSNHRSGKTANRTTTSDNEMTHFFVNEFEDAEHKNKKVKDYVNYAIRYFNAKYVELVLKKPLSSADIFAIRVVENPMEHKSLYDNVQMVSKQIQERNEKGILPRPFIINL